jgi:hypothetical protein
MKAGKGTGVSKEGKKAGNKKNEVAEGKSRSPTE